MNLTAYIHGTVHNGRGGTYTLRESVFVNCDARWITPGASVDISIQDGVVTERLVVQLDLKTRSLYVQSHYSQEEVVNHVNHSEFPL